MDAAPERGSGTAGRTVQTVTGPLAASSLGPTLMHEHVFSLYAEVRVQDGTWDEETRIAHAAAKLHDAYEGGIRTVVDLTVYGLGRNLRLLQRVSERSGVNIVAATGVYFFSEMPGYFRRRIDLEGPEVLEDLFVGEIEDGVFDTGIRAAVIKCALDREGVTKDTDLALRAAARAQVRTGVPLSTHTHPASANGLEQQRIFREEGVDPERVIIGHSGDTTDLDYLTRLLDGGTFLGMDRFGSYRPPPLDERVQTVATLCAKGYAERLVLSHDTNCWSDKVPDHLRGTRPECSPAPFTFVTDQVLPRLREAGVSEGQIDQMLVDNPRRIFAGTSGLPERSRDGAGPRGGGGPARCDRFRKTP